MKKFYCINRQHGGLKNKSLTILFLDHQIFKKIDDLFLKLEGGATLFSLQSIYEN